MSIRTLLALFPAALAAAAALALAAGSAPAEAAFSGMNGKIAFSDNGFIYSINPDGSGRTQLTSSGRDHRPAWSPDGLKIAFGRGPWPDDIYVMNADGSGQKDLTNHEWGGFDPAWSPDGQKIAFSRGADIYLMNADGSGQTRLTSDTALDGEPAWSPDGQKIAFARYRDGNRDIYVMNADGSGQTQLTNHAAQDLAPAWSPDGQKIAFTSSRPWLEIYVMNADGSGQTSLTHDSASDLNPTWSPDGEKIAFSHDDHFYAQIYVMNADGSGRTGVPGARSLNPDWQSLPIRESWPPISPIPPTPPAPVPVTAFPESTTIEAGTLLGGSARSLSRDDDVYFEVGSTTTGTTSETSWYGSMTVPNELTSLGLAYTGKYSHSCTQELELRDFDSGSWVLLDTSSIGTTEVEVVVKSLPGPLDRFVSGTKGPGELHFRVSCTGGDGDFVASGELMQIVYDLP